jgi:hypothetical protein
VAGTVRQRGVALFSLDRAAHGRAADVIANLVARDAAAVYAGYRRAAIAGDGLCWFSRCESLDPAALAELAAMGAGTGLASLLTTTSPTAAGWLAAQVGVLVLHRLDDRALARRLGWLAGHRLVPAAGAPAEQPAPVAGWPDSGGSYEWQDGGAPEDGRAPQAGPATPSGMCWRPVVTADALCALGEGEFTLITRAGSGRPAQLGAVGQASPVGQAAAIGEAGAIGQAGRVVPLAWRVPARIRHGHAGAPGVPGVPSAGGPPGRPLSPRGWPW